MSIITEGGGWGEAHLGHVDAAHVLDAVLEESEVREAPLRVPTAVVHRQMAGDDWHGGEVRQLALAEVGRKLLLAAVVAIHGVLCQRD
eukprot:9288955-Pyramimonas_sp.AAC.1